MGRKSIKRARKKKSAKTEAWANALLPKLKNLSLQSLTMNDIAALIGKSKSTVYEYFTTKEEILAYAVSLHLQQLSAYRSILQSDSEDLIACFEAFILFLGSGISKISHKFLNDLRLDFPEIWKDISAFIATLLSDIRLFYERGIKQGQFKNISPDLMTKMDELFVFQIISDNDFFERTQMTLEQVAQDYLRLKLDGFRV